MTPVMLITGGNKGIGYYMVKAWLEKGNLAVVLDLNCDEVNKLNKDGGNKLLTLVCDVTNENQVKESVEKAMSVFGKIDIAVHNACFFIYKDIREHSAEEYLQIYKVNFIGAVNLVKAVLPFMREAKQGRICLTSSGVGVTGFINVSGYAASKGAIESFAKCMFLENLDSGVTFHILHPPLTDTESASPLPVPKEFKANPVKVGYGFIRNIYKKSFVITPSVFDSITIKMSYWFPRFTGKMLVKMTGRAQKA